ncbi:MAG TPA: hypothetical protein VKD08_00095 [Ignavibacteriaceae bacterium]|jgi:hypothetical protein|nr:hypothetical protein [Ignavibacteriaceae bacterium]
MIGQLKDKIAGLLIKNKLKDFEITETNFRDFFRKSFNFFVAMPENDADFGQAFFILDYLDDNRKSVTVFTHDFKVNLLPTKFRQKAIGYSVDDISKLKLPSKRISDKLEPMRFQAVIDLNRQENLFCSYIVNRIKAPYKMGFAKGDPDKFYNIQVINNSTDAENSYKNLLNCLKMF